MENISLEKTDKALGSDIPDNLRIYFPLSTIFVSYRCHISSLSSKPSSPMIIKTSVTIWGFIFRFQSHLLHHFEFAIFKVLLLKIKFQKCNSLSLWFHLQFTIIITTGININITKICQTLSPWKWFNLVQQTSSE